MITTSYNIRYYAILAQTKKAWYVRLGLGQDEAMWCPKSQCTIDEGKKCIEIPDWLRDKITHDFKYAEDTLPETKPAITQIGELTKELDNMLNEQKAHIIHSVMIKRVEVYPQSDHDALLLFTNLAPIKYDDDTEVPPIFSLLMKKGYGFSYAKKTFWGADISGSEEVEEKKIEAEEKTEKKELVEVEKKEVWKDIEEYDRRYIVSDGGVVKSLKRIYNNSLITLKILKSGSRSYVALWKKGIRVKFLVDMLVAKAFIPNPKNLKFVGHKSNIEEDCTKQNLEWRKTPRRNKARGPANKLTEADIIQIQDSPLTLRKLAEIFQVSQNAIWKVKKKV